MLQQYIILPHKSQSNSTKSFEPDFGSSVYFSDITFIFLSANDKIVMNIYKEIVLMDLLISSGLLILFT